MGALMTFYEVIKYTLKNCTLHFSSTHGQKRGFARAYKINH